MKNKLIKLYSKYVDHLLLISEHYRMELQNNADGIKYSNNNKSIRSRNIDKCFKLRDKIFKLESKIKNV